MSAVSVVIATYRRPEAIIVAVACALRQTFSDLEIVVVVESDDQLTTEALANINDARVRHVVNPVKRGPAAARDFGVKQSRSKWIAFLDDDDQWDSDKLEQQFSALAGNESSICMTLSRVVSSNDTVIRPTQPYDGSTPIDEWLFDRKTWLKTSQSMLQTSSLLVPRAVFDHIEFGTSRHEEWELVIRAVKQLGYRLVTVNKPLVTYHAGNLYPWRSSVEWIDSAHDLLTPKACAGFCLTVATQGLRAPERNRAIWTFFGRAFRYGKPTAKQLLAFSLIWIMPDTVRHRLRALLSRA